MRHGGPPLDLRFRRRLVMITSVVVALILVAVILVGFPLLAWWFGNRRFWRRLRPSPTPVRPDDLRRRLGLTASELVQVQQAARGGRACTDPKMRAAVVAVAEQALERQRAPLIVGRAAGVLGLLGLVVGLAFGEFRDGAPVLTSVVWLVMVLNLFTQAAVPVFVHRRFRRAIELNSDPSEAHGEC